MRAAKPKGKQAIAAGLRAVAEAQHEQRRGQARIVVALRKLGKVAACIANEIAAASAQQTAELTALRQQLAASLEEHEREAPRRIGRRL